ncbi:hypothetical protein LEMLEM_LOCUS11179 [Lemmus lemmus]
MDTVCKGTDHPTSGH